MMREDPNVPKLVCDHSSEFFPVESVNKVGLKRQLKLVVTILLQLDRNQQRVTGDNDGVDYGVNPETTT
jgi:hypothetical protein